MRFAGLRSPFWGQLSSGVALSSQRPPAFPGSRFWFRLAGSRRLLQLQVQKGLL